jgi:hypothetical protein
MADYQLHTPVVFFIFNRPDTTQKVFQEIRNARPSKLLIIADGPRQDHPGEADRCAAARAIVERVDWPCTVVKSYSDNNLGCKQRLATGLDWVFEMEEEAIILEDDCLPHPTFFTFCQELLERYRDDERVALIRGDDWPGIDGGGNESYRFTMYPSIWGWATWRRVWRNYDAGMAAWSGEHDLTWLVDQLGTETMARYWMRAFEAVTTGQLDTWDLQLVYSCWRQGQLTVVPSVNLISNIGGGPEATLTKTTLHPRLGRPVSPMHSQLVHPAAIISNKEFDRKGELRAAQFERIGHALVSKIMGILSRFCYR